MSKVHGVVNPQAVSTGWVLATGLWAGPGLAVIAVLGVLGLAAPSVARATTYNVPNDYGTIQAAINACSEGDEVVIEPNTYTGAGNRDLDFGGTNITVRSTDPCDPTVVAATIIDCQGTALDLHRGFYFHSGEDANSVVAGLTITDGYRLGAGGGIYCSSSSPTIRNCTLSGNTVYASGLASALGGGIYCASGSPTITNCTIAGNTASASGSYPAGGGGIFCQGGSPTIRNCTFSGNTAEHPTVQAAGGAIFCAMSTSTVTNCTFSGNAGDDYGGGLLIDGGTMTVANCILWANTASSGHEIALGQEMSPTPATVTVKYCDVQGGQGQVYVEAGSTLNWSTGNINADPVFVDPNGPDGDPDTWADNDCHLSSNSPCVDAGDPNGDYTGQTDIDGEPRVMGPQADMGSDERQPRFTDIAAALSGAWECSLSWGDYDNDGDLDLALAGYVDDANWASKIYRNDGNDVFTDVGAALTPVTKCSLSWGDYDSDGDLDLAIAGSVSAGRGSKIYRNDGNDVFTDIGAALTSMVFSSLSWGDYDNDGDLDLALAGLETTDPLTLHSKIYRNDSNDVFTDIGAGLTGVTNCSLSWGDYDNDGDLDLAIAGWIEVNTGVSKIYRNDGNDVFTDIAAGLPGVFDCSLSWGDYDNDGDLDLAMAGHDNPPSPPYTLTKIYRNDANDVFTDIGAGLTALNECSLSWGDYDNDGDLDLAMAGSIGSPNYVTKIYRNDANGVFTDIDADLTGVWKCSLSWGDYDNDDDLDLVIAGQWYDGSFHGACKVYRNNGDVFNTPPSAPGGLGAVPTGDGLTFSWSATTDSQTPAAGLSYNLRIGTSSGTDDVFAGMADLGTGWRRVPATGNAQKRLSWALKGLDTPGATYYWSVQAVDSALAGSGWAAEQSYAFPALPTYHTLWLTIKNPTYGTIDIDPNDPNWPPFTYPEGTELTLTAEPNEGKKFTKWKVWDANDPNVFVLDTNNPIAIVMSADRKVKAFFKCGGGGIENALPLLMAGAVLCGYASWRRRRRG